MNIFRKKASLADKDPKSEATTVVPSENASEDGSNTNLEKENEQEAVIVEKGSTESPTSNSMEKTDALAESKSISNPNEGDTTAVKESEASNSPEDDEAEYPQGIKLLVIMLALALSVFLVALDNTIIATAIPKITDHFKAIGDVGWYGSAYLLTTCALQLFFGRLYTFFSIKKVYLISIVIFEIGSAVCGAAPTSVALIIGRAIAGVGSAGIFAGAMVIIAYSVPMVKRPIYTGLIGAMYGIASIAGPLLGGVFTDKLSWRWCFYINLPIGFCVFVGIIFLFSSPARKAENAVAWKERANQLDIVGTSVFIVDIICCLLGLQWGGSKYPWSNWRIILCLTLFAILTLVFIYIQWIKKENATVPFHIIRQRSVWAALWFAFCLGGAFFVILYWIPIWFQAIKGATAFKSGIMSIPLVLSLVLANIISGVGTTKLGYYVPFYYACVVLSAIGAGLFTTFLISTGSSKWIGYQVVYGLGVGFGMQQALITIQTVLPLKDVPTGAALSMFFQTFGGALFVSAAQNVFNNRLLTQVAVYAPNVRPDALLHVGATDLANTFSAADLPGIRLAYNSALTQTWYIAVAMTCMQIISCFFVEWRSVKGMKMGGGAAA